MTNEMMRPCTLWGQTFDACDVDEVCQCDNTLSRYEVDAIIRGEKLDPRPKTSLQVIVWLCGKMVQSRVVETYEDYYILFQEAITTIDDALKAPVLATQAVMAGLPKDAKVYTVEEKTGDALKCTFDNEFGWVCRTGHFNEALKLGRPYRIFTINDPKTAEYLRQFTLDGVRRVGNA